MEFSIAKEIYNDPKDIKEKIDYNEWVKFIDNNQNFFTWYENTPDGIYTLNNIKRVPKDFREGILLQLNRAEAHALFNSKKGFFELVIRYNPKYGFVRIISMKKLNEKIMEKLSDMANYLGGYLLKYGKKIK